MRRNSLGSGRLTGAVLALVALQAGALFANDDCPQGSFSVPTQPDGWGSAVAMDAAGTHALVGGPSAAGGNGRVRTFVNERGSWVEMAMLSPDQDFQAGAALGTSMAMSADGLTVVIGAPGDRHGGAFPFGGSVYVFVREAGSHAWVKQARLTQPSPGQRFNFGLSVAISEDGNTIAVGQVGATFFGVVVDSAWTFSRSGTIWSSATEIEPLVNDESEDFGLAVALSADGGMAIVGAPGQLAVGQGAAYVFDADGGNWTQVAKLTDSPPVVGSGLGRAVAVADSQVLVGSPFDSGGALHVHEEQDGDWVRTRTIRLPMAPTFQSFGAAISVRGDHILVGSPTNEFNMGTAFQLDRTNREWSFAGQMAPPSTDAMSGITAYYGTSVALSADASEFVIGAPLLANGAVFNVGKAYFPDFVTEAVVLNLEEDACTIGFGFLLPNGHFIFLNFDVIGQLWASLSKGCDETDEVSSYKITAIDLWTVQNKAVIEWRPDAALVFTDIHVALVEVGDAVMPNGQGLGTLSDYRVNLSVNLRIGEGKSIPMIWTIPISADIVVGTIGGAVTLTIPPTTGQVILDLGLGKNNPVATYTAKMFASELLPPLCTADIDSDGAVGASDLAILLGDWDAPNSSADLNDDGIVGAPDLAILLGAWGPCPR